MSSADAAPVISNLTAVTAALVAVSVAIVAVIPTFSRQVQEQTKKYSAQHFNKVFRRSFVMLFCSVILLVASALVGIGGLFWPTATLAYLVGSLTALGITVLGVGAGSFAFVTIKALL
jgi:hypothetical protein